MTRFRLVLCVVWLLVVNRSVFALLGPSFDLDNCSWDATHIVVVAKGQVIDGNVTVVESWRGDLKIGDKLTIPELAEFADAKRREIRPPFAPNRQQNPDHVTCSRMVLFLVKTTKEDGAGETVSWTTANKRWDKWFFVSMAWIEKNQVFAFVQWINPGDTDLIPMQWNECGLRCRVDEIVSARKTLAETMRIDDPDRLAKALLPFAKAESDFIRGRVIVDLGAGGKKTLSALRRILQDDSWAAHHWRAVDSLVKSGGRDVGPELTKMLSAESEFWQRRGPTLKKNWWNAGGGISWDEVEKLRDRYGKTLNIVRGLRELGYADSKGEVREFRDRWKSLPQLGEVSQMAEECDRLLSELK
jgi:hypothetical protein